MGTAWWDGGVKCAKLQLLSDPFDAHVRELCSSATCSRASTTGHWGLSGVEQDQFLPARQLDAPPREHYTFTTKGDSAAVVMDEIEKQVNAVVETYRTVL